MKSWIRSVIPATALAAALLLARHPRSDASSRRCNPLGGGRGEDCFLPFPSSFYLKPDPAAMTGLRVDLSHAALPSNSIGRELDPGPYDHRDGFSCVATLLAYFPSKIDPSPLPSVDHVGSSLTAASPVQLLDYSTGERIPLFAEPDANAKPVLGDRQGLVIQPIVRLRPKTRYIAVIQGLRSSDGKLIPPLAGFRALRDRDVTANGALEGMRPRFEQIFRFLGRVGIERSRTQLAWDFTTGSDEALTGRMLRMRDEALRLERDPAPETTAPVLIDGIEENPRGWPEIWRKITGHFIAPSFLEDGVGDRLRLGADGEPVFDRYQEFPLTIHLPACARSARGPLPVMIYGHGTFNSAENEMGTPYVRGMTDRLCMITVGTDWLGRSKSDLMYFIFHVLPDWNGFPQITDRLQQAHVNMLTLARLIRSGAIDDLPALKRNGRALVDHRRLYYYGISEGGCQGATTLALSADIDRGALNVPCGFWSMFFWRSSDFHLTRHVLRVSYPDALDEHKLMVLSQLLWDYTDPANYGGHLLRDPLAGSTIKPVLYQEGINDASVPNLTTEAMARTIGLKLLGPGVEPVMGIQTAAGPLDSAFVQFDVGSRPRLGGNDIPPPKSPVHEEVRRLEAAKEQVQAFLRVGGKVIDTCGGRPCVYSPSPERF